MLSLSGTWRQRGRRGLSLGVRRRRPLNMIDLERRIPLSLPFPSGRDVSGHDPCGVLHLNPLLGVCIPLEEI